MVLSVELSATAPSPPETGRSVGPLVLGVGSLEYLEQLHCHLQIADVEAFIAVPMQAVGEGRVNGVDALHMAGQFAYLSQNGLES